MSPEARIGLASPVRPDVEYCPSAPSRETALDSEVRKGNTFFTYHQGDPTWSTTPMISRAGPRKQPET